MFVLCSLATLACAATWLSPLERGDTGGAASAARRAEIAEDTRPVLEGRMHETSIQSKKREETEEIVCSTVSASREPDLGLPPPDPVEHGRARLVVTVDSTGAPHQGSLSLQLWRLGAPGNALWREGDQLQAEGDVEDRLASFENLPEGMYRISSKHARVDGEDPPAFVVRGARTEVRVTLDLPRAFPVWLRVVDGDGHLVTRGLRTIGGGSTYEVLETRPAWLNGRVLREADEIDEDCAGMSCACGCSGEGNDSPPAPVVADEHGFPWGSHLESSRCTSWSSTDELLVDDCNGVTVHVHSDDGHELTYHAVALAEEVLVREVYLADGRHFVRGDGLVVATCEARLLGKQDPSESWRTLAINVKVTVPGHVPLEFVASVEDPSPKHTLERLEDSGPR